MSFQDRFNIAGYDSACGHIAWLNRLRNEKDEGALVKKLKEAGAVFFAKTNVPMSMLVSNVLDYLVARTLICDRWAKHVITLSVRLSIPTIGIFRREGPPEVICASQTVLIPLTNVKLNLGEGALLALRGSPLGWASDIGNCKSYMSCL